MSDSCDSYKIKRLTFLGGRRVPIFLQNINGPCPLLGIANVLSLRNQLQVASEATEITTSQLITLVAEHYLDANKLHDVSNENSEWAINLRQNLSDGLSVLHKLATGIDVNVKYHSITGFEPTPELVLFDLLDIRLVHGWLVDPQDRQTAQVFGDRSYNQLVEFLINQAPSGRAEPATSVPVVIPQPLQPPARSGDDELDIDKILEDILESIVYEHQGPGSSSQAGAQLSVASDSTVGLPQPLVADPHSFPQSPAHAQQHSAEQNTKDRAAVEALLVRTFLEDTCQQLTVFGLAKLFEDVKEHELAVFFRNNHFSTLFKHQGGLYILVTDQGYLSEPDISWEKLDVIDGDTHFYTGTFEPFVPHASIAHMAIGDYSVQEDADTSNDLELALQLQEQERLRFEEDAQRQQQLAAAQSAPQQWQTIPPQQQQQWQTIPPQQQQQWQTTPPQQQQQQQWQTMPPQQQQPRPQAPPPQQQQSPRAHVDSALLAGLPQELLEEDRLAREMLEQTRQQARQRQAQQQQQQQQQAPTTHPGYSPRQQQQAAATQPAPARTTWGRQPARQASSEDTKCTIM